MAYIEVHQSLFTHRKTLKLCRLLGLDRFAVIGRLVALWQWGLDNTPEGDLGEDFPDYVGEVMGWPGDPSPLLAALDAAGFVVLDAAGHYHIHDWMDYAGKLIEKRKSDAERKRLERWNKSASLDVQRTSDGHPSDGAGNVANRSVEKLNQPKRTPPQPPQTRARTREELPPTERGGGDGGLPAFAPGQNGLNGQNGTHPPPDHHPPTNPTAASPPANGSEPPTATPASDHTLDDLTAQVRAATGLPDSANLRANLQKFLARAPAVDILAEAGNIADWARAQPTTLDVRRLSKLLERKFTDGRAADGRAADGRAADGRAADGRAAGHPTPADADVDADETRRRHLRRPPAGYPRRPDPTRHGDLARFLVH